MKKINKVILVITDGIGHNSNDRFNGFNNAKKPTYDWLFKNVPNSLIKTSGKAVGLPDGQMGNSEVGHMSIGSGRILYQNLVKISMSIQDDSLKDNNSLKEFLAKNEIIHIIGLASDGGVHSHIEHFKALAKIAKDAGKKVLLHLITDGRDVSPTSGIHFIKEIEEIVNDNIEIATISGRYYAMDRDNRWDRVKKAYKAMAAANPKTQLKPLDYIKSMYEDKITDEFILPTAFSEFNGIKEGEGLLFINFRNDRVKEIVSAFGDENFKHFQRLVTSLNIITMTKYDDNFTYKVLFENTNPENTLCDVISREGLTQLHTAETEKYAHVTFFFNGGKETPLKNETRVLIPSPKVATYDLQPQMSCPQVCDVVLKGIDFGYDFIVVNFANGDMVGHTGNYEATIKAVEAVDDALGKIIKKAQEKDYALVLTSDHGNCESMRDKDDNPLTNHTTFDVYCFVMAKGIEKVKNGGLSNIAPSILKLMGLEIPSEMNEPLI